MRKPKKCLVFESHKEQGERTSHCWYCREKVGLTVEETIEEGIALIPLEVKQKFMDELKAGKNLGEATQIAGIQGHRGLDATMFSAALVVKQIRSARFLDFEVK